MNNTKPNILIIYTGGTIGMIEDEATGTLRPFNFDHLIENVPKINKLGYDISHIQFDEPIDSSDMDPECWKQIAKCISDSYAAYDGFVVLHGTDTMAYTASALSFMLGNLHKPVIITGSQLPIGEVRTDGEENLITALQIAAARDAATGEPMIQEVAILFENYLWRGNRSTKMSADNFNAFKSNNYPPLANIGLGIHFNNEALWRTPSNRPLDLHLELDPSVVIIDLFPGITQSTLHHLLNTPGAKGIILKTYGAGNAPTNDWFYQEMSDAIKRGLVVLNITQCANGGVNNRYYAGDRLARAGVISGYDMTGEAAVTKMMHLFGMGLSNKDVSKYLCCSLIGEITV
ncbi:MAG: asparaginase [Muribaculaceae bacterium]|nr:asparaginase [Muribaculaceae bacterium]